MLVRPGGVLFLDLSRTVGWAYGADPEAEPLWGVWRLPAGFELGRVFASYENELLRAFEEYGPAKVGMEAPLPASQQTDAFTAELQIGLAAITECACYRWDKPLMRRSSQTIRSAVIGRAHRTDAERQARIDVKKAIVEPWVAARGWRITDHNSRDAAVGLAYELGVRHVRQGRRQRADDAPQAGRAA
ncbi:MAG: hypothetical protein WDN25_13290 [Acetobacteraceae bacterium]